MPRFDTVEEVQAYARELAADLPRFTVMVLVGALGAGKTTFMKGLAAGWGVADAAEVTSPTYTLIHEYHAPAQASGRGARTLYHLDLYRIETGAQLATLGLDDILRPPAEGEAKLIAIEWGERIEATLPRPYLRIEIVPDPTGNAETREITANWQ